MTLIAVLDANVLVPGRVRDVLLTLAEAELYSPVWTSEILAETVRHLPESMSEVAKSVLVRQMRRAFPEACVEISPELSSEALAEINPKDRHVLLAALVTRADTIVTEDATLRDECQSAARSVPFDLDAQGCATFTAWAVDVSPERAAEALRHMAIHRWAKRNPEGAWDRLLAWMRTQNWQATVELLDHIHSDW